MRAMARVAGRLRRRLMGLAEDGSVFDSDAFLAAPETTRRLLEDRAAGLREGFNAGLELPTVGELVDFAEDTAADRRLFRFEGAAMACALLDLIPHPGCTRWARLMAARGTTRGHVLGIGRGWAYGALSRSPRPSDPEPPDTAGAVWEGRGFHDALFGHLAPVDRLPCVVAGSYLHGAGRALWFIGGADAVQVAASIDDWSLPDGARHEWTRHVWSGAAFAATLVGGADDRRVELLRRRCPDPAVAYAGAVSAVAISVRADRPSEAMMRRASALGAPDWPQCLALDIEALAMGHATAHLRRIHHFKPPVEAATEPGDPPECGASAAATTKNDVRKEQKHDAREEQKHNTRKAHK